MDLSNKTNGDHSHTTVATTLLASDTDDEYNDNHDNNDDNDDYEDEG